GGFNGTEMYHGQRNPSLYETRLSGDINGDDSTGNTLDNASRVIRINPDQPASSSNGDEVVLLDGLTISDANSSTTSGGGVGTNYPGVYQRGIRMYNCIFENNVQLNQAAFNFYTSYQDPVLEVSNCIFRNNHSYNSYLLEFRVTYSYQNDSYATFTNNLFENNDIILDVTSGGGIGGRFTNLTSDEFLIQYTNNTFIGNKNDQDNFHKTLFVLERANSLNSDVIVDMDNNLFFDNDNLDSIAMNNNAYTNTKYIGANCKNNGGDWNQLNNLNGSIVNAASPFVDYAADDFRPTTTYSIQGDTGSYHYTWTDYDLAGEDRMDYVNGTIAIGAYERGFTCQNTTVTLTEEVCGYYESPSGNEEWTVSGTYVDTIPNHCGMDSIITINLTVLVDLSISVSNDSTVLTANQNNATYQWHSCANPKGPINGATSQSFTPTTPGTYLVEIVYDGCDEESDCIEIDSIAPTSVSDIDLNQRFQIFPNPAQDFVQVSNNYGGKVLITIYNLTGAAVRTETLTEQDGTISLEGLMRGYYYISLNSKDGVVTKKLLKL
ncbi:MAG: T9SS type A sorting domain-containing protein, partial [Salibacteraceae bacterium]